MAYVSIVSPPHYLPIPSFTSLYYCPNRKGDNLRKTALKQIVWKFDNKLMTLCCEYCVLQVHVKLVLEYLQL